MTAAGDPVSATFPMFLWVNILPRKVRSALRGTHCALRPRLLQRYLSEFCDRINVRCKFASQSSELLPPA